MKITCSDAQTLKILLDNIYPDEFDTKSGVTEKEYKIEDDNYNIYLTEKWFYGTYISYLKLNGNTSNQFCLENSETNIVFLFCLNGTIKCRDSFEKEIVTLIKNEQYISGSLNNLTINFTDNTEYFYLQLTQMHYKNLTGKEFNSDVSVYASKAIAPEIKIILNSLINQNVQDRIKRISIEARIYELILFFLNKAYDKPALSLKKDDLDKILYAKKLVENNLQSPFSLIELSRQAGINDYKLKIGFKELTGYTVFGYLYKIRMELAYYYLSKERKTVNEVAFLVGYKNTQHFTVAFKKMYNILPGSFNRDKFLYANV